MGLFTRLEKFDQKLTRGYARWGALGVADANSDPRGLFFTVCRNINLGSSNWRSHIGDP